MYINNNMITLSSLFQEIETLSNIYLCTYEIMIAGKTG